jgi:hypothetical protein
MQLTSVLLAAAQDICLWTKDLQGKGPLHAPGFRATIAMVVLDMLL